MTEAVRLRAVPASGADPLALPHSHTHMALLNPAEWDSARGSLWQGAERGGGTCCGYVEITATIDDGVVISSVVCAFPDIEAPMGCLVMSKQLHTFLAGHGCTEVQLTKVDMDSAEPCHEIDVELVRTPVSLTTSLRRHAIKLALGRFDGYPIAKGSVLCCAFGGEHLQLRVSTCNGALFRSGETRIRILPQTSSRAVETGDHKWQPPKHETAVIRDTPCLKAILDQVAYLYAVASSSGSAQLFDSSGVVICGPSGSGKTSLALAAAGSSGRSAKTLYLSSGILLGEAGSGSGESVVQSLKSAIGAETEPPIVILDDLETLLPPRDASSGGAVAPLSLAPKRRAMRLVLDILGFCRNQYLLQDGSEGTVSSPRLRAFIIALCRGDKRSTVSRARRLMGPGDLAHCMSMPHLGHQGRRAVLDNLLQSHQVARAEDADSWPSLLGRVAGCTGGFLLRDLRKLADHVVAHRRVKGLCWKDFASALAEIQPSLLSSLDARVPSVSFADVGGCADAKRRLLRSVSWQDTYRGAAQRLSIQSASGVILHGPPGCGKTLLAEALAHEVRANFLAVQLSDILSPYLGESEAYVRRLFATARAVSPCILLFDELDVLAAHRSLSGGDATGGSGSVAGRILGTMLNEMDGVETNKEVLVLATTNRLSSIDAALLRPGRLDVHIQLTSPDAAALLKIFRVHTARMPLATDVSLEGVANNMLTTAHARSESVGCNGADVKWVCREAAMEAMRKKRDEVDLSNFRDAVSAWHARGGGQGA